MSINENLNKRLDECHKDMMETSVKLNKKMEEMKEEIKTKTKEMLSELNKQIMRIGNEQISVKKLLQETTKINNDKFEEVERTMEEIKTQQLQLQQDFVESIIETEAKIDKNVNKMRVEIKDDLKDKVKEIEEEMKNKIRKIKKVTKEELTWEDELSYIRSALVEEARSWLEIHITKIKCFKEFEKMFLENYWSCARQRKLMMEFGNGQYDRSMEISREKYATKKLSVLQYLDISYDENMLVMQLAQQCGLNIITKVIEDIKNVAGFIRLVKEVDEMEEVAKNFKKYKDIENYGTQGTQRFINNQIDQERNQWNKNYMNGNSRSENKNRESNGRNYYNRGWVNNDQYRRYEGTTDEKTGRQEKYTDFRRVNDHRNEIERQRSRKLRINLLYVDGSTEQVRQAEEAPRGA
ncbi:hypothetical protein ILUMI_02998 [Ignelater luminosus]|uniref:Uncharacterized protein n=1 Tax=Ignelater luminosus TaxID=2038154 RepID=A0A8K0GKW3_IGNLU|nr:hypothetical protein ILUMI_02998 [Ignelater luminosus]